MRALQKLVRNGNSTQLTILRTILVHLGWIPGELVVVEVQEDKSLRVYKPSLEPLGAKRMRPQIEELSSSVER